MSDSIVVRSASDANPQAEPATQADETKDVTDTSAPADIESDEVETSDDSEPSGTDEADENDAKEEVDGDEPKKDDKADKKPSSDKRQNRIKRLSSKLGDAVARAAAAEAKLAALEAKALGAVKPDSIETGDAQAETKTYSGKPKPKSDDFDSVTEYAEALTDWKLAESDAKKAADSAVERIKSEVEQEAKIHLDRVAEFKKSEPGFENAVQEFMADNPGWKPSPAFNHLVATSEHGPAILFELVNDPDNLLRINQLSLAAAGREIGKIEARLESSKDTTPKMNKTSTAPKPVKPVSSVSGSANRTIQNADSQAEYERMRKAKKK